jgi:O-antigen/teichoic acid export membrane protein
MYERPASLVCPDHPEAQSTRNCEDEESMPESCTEDRRPDTTETTSSRNKAVALTIVSNAVTMACGAAGSVLAARLLGREGRGELAAMFVWVAVIAAIGDFGISQSCSYYGAKIKAPGTAAGTALALGIGTALLIIACLMPFWGRIFGTALPGASLYLFSIPLSVTATYLAAILQGMNRLSAFNLIRVVQAAVYPLGVLAAWITGAANVRAVLSMALLCQCGATIITLTVATRILPLTEWRVSKPLVRQLYSYGSRCYMGNLFWLANGRLDQALLTFLAPMRDLGLYAVAVSYSGILFGLSGALATVLFPRVAGARSIVAGRREIRHTVRLLAAIAVPLGALMGLAGPWAIPAAFGHAFDKAIHPANILLAGGVILGINYILSNGLRAAGRPGAPVFAEVAGLLVSVVGLPLVLPRWGIIGAAWISVASYTVTAASLTWLSVMRVAPQKVAPQ